MNLARSTMSAHTKTLHVLEIGETLRCRIREFELGHKDEVAVPKQQSQDEPTLLGSALTATEALEDARQIVAALGYSQREAQRDIVRLRRENEQLHELIDSMQSEIEHLRHKTIKRRIGVTQARERKTASAGWSIEQRIGATQGRKCGVP
jgi:hypothetical protein